MERTWRVTRVAEWTGWCSPCGRQDRPLVLTRSGPAGPWAWLSGLGDEDCSLQLTCRLCGQWQVVPLEAEDEALAHAAAGQARPVLRPVPVAVDSRPAALLTGLAGACRQLVRGVRPAASPRWDRLDVQLPPGTPSGRRVPTVEGEDGTSTVSAHQATGDGREQGLASTPPEDSSADAGAPSPSARPRTAEVRPWLIDLALLPSSDEAAHLLPLPPHGALPALPAGPSVQAPSTGAPRLVRRSLDDAPASAAPSPRASTPAARPGRTRRTGATPHPVTGPRRPGRTPSTARGAAVVG